MSEARYASADDEAAIARSHKVAKARAQKRLAALRYILAERRGRAFVWALLEEAGVYRQTFVPGDPGASAFNEGRRAAGLELLDEITRVAPDAYLMAQREALADRKEDHAATEDLSQS